MRKELDEKLCADYPLIFANRHGDKYKTCMVWGFQCGDGWYNLINRLCRTIQHHIDSTNERREWCLAYNARIDAAKEGNFQLLHDFYTPWESETPEHYEQRLQNMLTQDNSWTNPPEVAKQVVAEQVKEKFGGLRFYVRNADNFVWGAITLAESLSVSICDVCGGPGKVGNQSLTFDEPHKEGVFGYYATRCKQHWGNNHEQDDTAWGGLATYK